MAIKALDEKIQRGNKVSLPVAVSTVEKVESSPDIQSLVNESVKTAIAVLKNELLDDLKKDKPIE
jgi:hypothetical protein